MLTPVTPREYLWGVAWATAIGAVTVSVLELANVTQFVVQYGLCVAVLMLPALLALNLSTRRRSRLPLRWQVVLILCAAAALAGSPWTASG